MIFYTNAPERYDYGFTYEVDPDVGNFTSGIGKDNPVRKIDIIDSGFNIENQTNRNSSGLYPTIDQEQMDDWLKYEYFIPKGGGDENSDAAESEATPSPLDAHCAHCAHCNSAARIDELGTTCRHCGRGIIVTRTATDAESEEGE